jgi:hypothetical protein
MLTIISCGVVWTDGRITNKDILGNYSGLHTGTGITNSKVVIKPPVYFKDMSHQMVRPKSLGLMQPTCYETVNIKGHLNL